MKTDKRVIKTKRYIREAFCSLIMKKDLSAISITEIATVAEIDRKTFYLHYSSVEAIWDEFANEVAEKVRILLNSQKEFDISAFFNGLNDIMMENLDLYKRFSSGSPYSFFLVRCKNILKASLTEHFYENSCMSPAIFNVYAEYTSTGIISIYTNWLGDNSTLTLAELTHTAEDTMLLGWQKLISK